jgi:ABC-2 type transport system permease protein
VSVTEAIRGTLAELARDRGMLIFFAIAVPVYSFFYPLPYSAEAVRHIPIDVVDLDASPLSRQVAREIAASPSVRYVANAATVEAAARRMANGEIAGFVVIPDHFQRDALRASRTAVTVFGTGAFPVQDRAVLGAAAAATAEVAGATGAARLAREGAPPSAFLRAAGAGPAYIDEPLFNTARGYGSYVVPAVSILIVHQILLIGIAGLVGTWVEFRQGPLLSDAPLGLSAFAGTVAVFAFAAYLALLYMIGFSFWFHDFPRSGNFAGALAFGVMFALAIALLGISLGCWLADRERALQLLLTTSVPCQFLSGAVFPREAIPLPLQWFSDLLPTTPGIIGFVGLNQMNASWWEIRGEVAHLALLVALYATTAWLGVRWRRGASRVPAEPRSPARGATA